MPLLAGDGPPLVELGALLHAACGRTACDLRIDYRSEPDPPLRPDVRAWVNDLVRANGLR